MFSLLKITQTRAMGGLIVAESALSFLGFGAHASDTHLGKHAQQRLGMRAFSPSFDCVAGLANHYYRILPVFDRRRAARRF